jgi:NAD(P)-dependent dehydrogenase (short-subunit alcohol dehydrogenase family)
MELRDSVIVVTGGASGIGAAMCRRFASEFPRHVRVVDRDREGADDVAASLRDAGVDATASALDVTDRSAVEALVDEVRREAGGIDLFCANAGIGTGAGVEAADEVWEQAWQVNVHAHVLAARALLPHWLDRGRGHLLTTASAAGLLTNLGDAPYSVTKHAAVAFAEWLSITYGDRGVTVSCLCPQGVRTPLLFGSLGDGALATEVVYGNSFV